MREHNILIGNGINIAFSENDDYKNFKIIERLMQNLETRRYDEVFGNTIEPNELKDILISLNEIFKDMIVGIEYLRYTATENELRTLIEISKRYKDKLNGIVDVGMEDYFFVAKILFNRLGDEETPLESLYLGLKYLFLDAIYNNGKIEKLHTKMYCYKNELKSYKNIFTINYDTNLDKITENEVYHLHGSFETLEDKYRSDTILGHINQKRDNPHRVIDDMKHIYCNAIMSYSGEKKLEEMELPNKLNLGVNEWAARINNPIDIEAQERYSNLQNSTQQQKDVKEHLDTKLEYPELNYSEYPLKEFQSINGVLSIIGMSPNNDTHILKMINENPNIKKVIYYYASSEDSANAQEVIKKPKELRNVFKYWEKIKSK